MILTIQKGTDNQILRQKAEKVKEITPEIKELISDMIKTMDTNNGIGLAAPQIGKSLQIAVIRPDVSENAFVLINPKIIKKSIRKDVVEEGCLSLPNIAIKVKRPIQITITATDLNNQPITIKIKGILARVIQHEIDHLKGILIVDKDR
ncbi:MAG: peptide deformylase [bacterium]